MTSWLSLLFEAGLAVLMAALIVYCVKLNRRLAALRSQNAEIGELVAGLRDASERADLSVQRLKAAGLAAERSLRAAIGEATAAQARLARLADTGKAAAPSVQAASPATPKPAAAAAPPSARAAGTAAPARKGDRDMLMGGDRAPAGPAPVPAQERPKTRREAEETLLQAIRSARGGV